MPIQVGTRLGSYEILLLLGVGGMGEVYRARDTRLGRDVAIKVLPEPFATDPDRVARFEREAQLLASLNHPHIASIQGLEVGPEGAGVSARAIVMELVEGPTLADRLSEVGRVARSGPATSVGLPLDEALPIARQIAEALEAAHERGVAHRDLKPANIKVRADGTVKILDFGLAKLTDPPVSTDPHALSQSPTLSVHATMAGTILGTAAYMSPEQARGKPVDRRTDIWAFGCVLFEMLTGAQVFAAGETISDTVAAILKNEPDWGALPAETPDPIRTLLRRCLQKDAQKRLPHIGLARMEIEETLAGGAFGLGGSAAPNAPYGRRPGDLQPSGAIDPAARMSRRRERAAWAVGLATVAVVALGEFGWGTRSPSPTQEVRLEINTPPTSDAVSLALSPDGRSVVFEASVDGRSQLWLRPMDAVASRPLPGTDHGSRPFWSPDSRSVAFFADGALRRIDIEQGTVQTLVDTGSGSGMGGTWAIDGTILYAPGTSGPLLRMAAAGGEPVVATRLDVGQSTHRLPHFLPDGRHFTFYARGEADATGVYVGQLGSLDTTRLFDSDSAAVFASNHLLFVRDSTLYAQRFDVAALSVSGSPLRVATGITVAGGAGVAVSASAAGPVVYRGGSVQSLRQLTWVDRSGRRLSVVGSPVDGDGMNLSPDGRRVAMYIGSGGNNDIWLMDVSRGLLSRFTSSASSETFPIWSPDGRRIVFGSDRAGTSDLYEKLTLGSSAESLLFGTPETESTTDWSLDGRFLLYRGTISSGAYDLWVLPLEGDRKPIRLTQTPFDERDGQFSPDVKWVAYQSDESGQFEVYLQPFPGPGERIRVSTEGGAQVRWRRDSRELYYLALDERLMAVAIRASTTADGLEIGAPEPLFATHVGGALQGVNRQQYMVSPDGQQFLMNTLADQAATPLTAILNWTPGTAR